MILPRVLLALPALLVVGPWWATWRGDAVTPLLQILSTAVLVLTAMRPAHGLLVVVALLPLATQIQVLSGSPFSGAESAELLVVPFLLAATLHAALTGEAAASRLAWPAALLAATVLGSATVGLASGGSADTVTPAALAGHLDRTYYSDPAAFAGLRMAIRWSEALLLAVLVERVLRRDADSRAAATRLLLIGGAAAAAFAVLRLSEVSIRTLDPWRSAFTYLSTLRMNPHYGDANAAGSFYVLCLVPMVWLGWHPRWRWVLALTPVPLLALWMTGSRAAIGAALVSLAALWALERRPRPIVLAGALGLAILAAGVITSQYGRTRASPAVAAGIRVELSRIGLQLAVEDPVFGVGVGQFRRASSALITPEFAARFPSAAAGENAHNQFVQILAELGLVGFGLWVWLLASAATGVAAAIRSSTATPEGLALAGGLLAFLLSCLLGHPLIITQVLFAFCAVLGLTTAWHAGAAGPSAPGRARVGLVLLLGLLMALPIRIASVHRAPEPGAAARRP